MKLLLFYAFLGKLFLTGANVPQLDGRIVGGENANITDFPYQASLRKFNSHVCGASIFHSNYVLTAAHCVTKGAVARSYTIRAGSNYLTSGGSLFQVCELHVHENYSADTMVNDIAILKLCTPVTFSNYILPITLAALSDTIEAGIAAVITGWGYTKEEGSVSSTLKKVTVPIVPIGRCKILYADEVVTQEMICAGYIGVGNKDACQGDSGGPLIAKGKQYGVVSWGYGCARPLFPGVYTNVAKYRSWVKKITKY